MNSVSLRADALMSQNMLLVEERLDVATRSVETARVRISKRVFEHVHEADVNLTCQHVVVERVAPESPSRLSLPPLSIVCTTRPSRAMLSTLASTTMVREKRMN